MARQKLRFVADSMAHLESNRDDGHVEERRSKVGDKGQRGGPSKVHQQLVRHRRLIPLIKPFCRPPNFRNGTDVRSHPGANFGWYASNAVGSAYPFRDHKPEPTARCNWPSLPILVRQPSSPSASAGTTTRATSSCGACAGTCDIQSRSHGGARVLQINGRIKW
jgi:hypothetical protein